MTRGVRWLAMAWVSAVLTGTSGQLAAQTPSNKVPRDAPWLLGGPIGSPASEVEVDPALPRGALRWQIPRPATTNWARLCSTTEPVCVHVAPSALANTPEAHQAATEAVPARARAALHALERAHETLVRLEGLPPPERDAGSGGGDQLDWYLPSSDEASRSTASLPWLPREEFGTTRSDFHVHLEPIPSRGFDRAAAFCVGGEAALSRSAHLCIAEASAAARTPAHGPHIRRAYGTHLWWQRQEPELRDRWALRQIQTRPEAGLLWRQLQANSEGAALLFEYLVLKTPSDRRPALLSTAALQLAPTRTAPGALRWHSEPDLADVLRSSFGGNGEAHARFWDGLVQSRLLVGRTQTWIAWASPEERLEPSWQLKVSSLPRNLALARPLQPTGSAVFLLELDRPSTALALRATCEAPVPYVWSVARYGPDWRHISTLNIPFKERDRVTEHRITELDGVRHLVVSGTNLGGVDLAHPFDPDHAPFEPHGCSVYFAEL